MATSAQQQQALAEQQRQAQVQNQQAFLAEFIALWTLLDVQALDATTDAWAAASMRLIRQFRLNAARLAVEFYEALRRLALPSPAAPMPRVLLPGDQEPREPDLAAHHDLGDVLADVLHATPAQRRVARQLPVTLRIDFFKRDPAVDASLRITGPINIKDRIKRAQRPQDAARAALVDASGAASRHVLDGGRDTTLEVIEKDPVAVGWIRVTDSDPCYFCAMLASRGPVKYKAGLKAFDESDAQFQGPGTVKVHDHCACILVPYFGRQSAVPEQNREFQLLWNEHIRGKYSGQDAINAWRRLHERPELFKRKAAEQPQRRRRAA